MQCQAINIKNKKQCSKQAIIGDYCITHHCYINNLKHKKINKDDGFIDLSKGGK